MCYIEAIFLTAYFNRESRSITSLYRMRQIVTEIPPEIEIL